MKIRGAVLNQSPVAAPYTQTRPLTITDLELADPRAGEVLVRIEAAGICHSDLSVIDGTRPRPTPMLLGHEAAGVIEALGPGVRGRSVGDHVVLVYVPSCGACEFCASGRPALCSNALAANAAGELVAGGSRLTRAGNLVNHHLGLSAFATHAVVDSNAAVPIDQDVPFETAALFGCAMLTGYGAVAHTAGVRPGESCVIFGLGGVGQAAVMAAVAAGAYPVVAVDPIASKQQRALALGATRACAPDQIGTDRFAWAFEAVGSAPVFEAAYSVTARGGTTVSIGLTHPEAQIRIPALSLVAESRSILGSYMGSAQPLVDIPAMVAMWRAGRLPVDRLVSSTISLGQINEAMDALASGEAVRQVILPQRS